MHFCLSPVVDIMANCKAFALKQIKFRICWPTNSLLTDLLTASVKCSSLLFAPLWWNLDTVGGTGPYGGVIVRYWRVFLVLQSQFLATKGKATSKLLLLYYAYLKSVDTIVWKVVRLHFFLHRHKERERMRDLGKGWCIHWILLSGWLLLSAKQLWTKAKSIYSTNKIDF